MPLHLALRSFTALAGSLLALLVTTRAAAQSIEVADVIERAYGFRPADLQPNWINHADCVGPTTGPNKDIADSYTFTVNHANISGQQFEVWVGESGADCLDPANRTTGSAPLCWQVYSSIIGNSPASIVVSARDIAGKRLSSNPDGYGPGVATIEDCDSGSSSPIAVTLHFMALNGDTVLASGTFTKISYDLLGPAAPTGISTGIGEDKLFVKFKLPTAQDLRGFKAYCDPKPGSTTPSTGGTAGSGGTTATGGAAGTSGAAGTAGASGASGASATDAGVDASTDASTDAGGTTTEGGTTTDSGSGSGGSTGNPACPSTALVPGEIPNSEFECGSTSSQLAQQVEAEGLINFVTYAVAVAAIDDVGNSGPLSAVACGRPEPIDDFFELYTRAGGKGGGGFCAIGADPSSGLVALLGVTLGAWLLRRRRRG